MNLTRRFFLGGVAAAAALLRLGPAAQAQPVPVVPPPAPLPPPVVPSPTGMWQDIARQIPATKTGDPVAYVTGRFNVNGEDVPMVQPDPDLRPKLGTVWKGQHYIEFDKKEGEFLVPESDIPKLKVGKGVQISDFTMISHAAPKTEAAHYSPAGAPDFVPLYIGRTRK